MTQPIFPSSTPTPPSTQPLRGRIIRIRNRQLTVQLIQSLLVTLSAFIIAMLLAMAVDFFAIYLSPTTRITLTTCALTIAFVTFLYQLLRTLRQPRDHHTVARFIEQWRPELAERWSTALCVTDNPAANTNPALTAALINQSNAYADVIDLRNIIDLTPLKRTITFTTILTLILAATFTTTRTRTLALRFLQPNQPITYTNITATTNTLAVINEPWQITADITNPLTNHATLLLRAGNQTPITHPMHPTDNPKQFTFTSNAHNQNFSYAIRCGDHQTPFQSITTTHRPQITTVTCQSRYFDNSRLITTTQSALPSRLTLRPNTELTLSFTTNKPLKTVSLNNITLHPDTNNQYVYATTITQPQTLSITLHDHHNLTAAQPTTLDIRITQPLAKTSSPSTQIVDNQTALTAADLSNQIAHILNTTAQLTQQPTTTPDTHQQILIAATKLLTQAAETADELAAHTQSTSAQPLAQHHRATINHLIKQLEQQQSNPTDITTDINQARLNITNLTELWNQNHQQSLAAKKLDQSLKHHQSFTSHLQPILKQSFAPAQKSAALNKLQQSHLAAVQSSDNLSSHDTLARQLLNHQSTILKRLIQNPERPLTAEQLHALNNLMQTYQREQQLLTQLITDLQSASQPLPVITTTAATTQSPEIPSSTPPSTRDFNIFTDKLNHALRQSKNTSYTGPYKQTINSYFKNLSNSHTNPETAIPTNP